MSRNRNLSYLLAAALFLTPLASFAYNNPTPKRSYVSLQGSDANNCGATAPCGTWQAALAQTQPGGEIMTLNSGGYGLLNITQAVTIVVPPGVYGGMSPSAGADGVVINVPIANGFVTLRGVTINGQSGANNGINVQNGSVLILEDSTIENVTNGILATDSSINVSNSRIHEITGTGMRQTELHLSDEDRELINAYRSKGQHHAREVNRAHVLSALDRDTQHSGIANHDRPEYWTNGHLANAGSVSGEWSGICGE